MSEDQFNLPDSPAEHNSHSTAMFFAVIVVAMAVALVFIIHSKSTQKVRDAQRTALVQEVTADEAALTAQKDKIVQLHQQLDDIKQKFQLGLIKDSEKPAMTKQYNDLLAQERDERAKYDPLVSAYNEKVSELNDLK